MAHRWIMTASGRDRPGIVAGVAKTLYRLGCNLEDSAMTRLGGEFAIMLAFTAPAAVSEAALRKALFPLERTLALAVHLKPLAREAAAARGAAHTISVYGADRPGIVYRISELLARLGVNITDVETRRGGEAARARALYLLVLEVELPPRVTAAALAGRLTRLAKTLGVEVSLRPAEADVL